MQFDVIRSQTQFAELEQEWNELLFQSASHVPFLRHEYLSAWWRTLGGGEWQSGDLCILVARHSDGTLSGIAPLFFTQNLENQPALMLLGSKEISDYLDVIVRPQDVQPFLNALLERLGQPDMPAWEVLDWYNILDNSPTLPALKTAAQSLGWSFAQEQLQHCPYIPLPGDWDEYLAGIHKKQRHEIRRKMRRAADAEEGIRWYFVEDEDELEPGIDAFLTLMAQDEEKQTFLTDIMRTQMRAAVWAAFRAGWLQLSFLEVGGQRAAGYLNFDYADRIWVYNSGMNFDLGAYSPGWVLLGYLLQWANENKRKAFDFMRGDESYKYRFGAQDRFVMRAQVRRES